MTFKEIKELIKLLDESNLSEFRMETEDLKLILRTKEYYKSVKSGLVHPPPAVGSVHLPAPPPPAGTHAGEASKSPEQEEAPAKEVEYLEIRSPIVGTFYRAPAPDKPPFVQVGDTVQPGDVVCIVEAMKLFNDIESEVAGKIVKVLVEDATPVEYDQVLFLVDPNG